MFTRGLLADVISAPDLGAWEIRLVDIDPEALSVAVRLAERMVQARRQDDRVSVQGSVDRDDLLPGADVVVAAVGVGGRSAWLRDWEIASDFDVYQPVGDSVMPGGVSRAMRTVPVMVDIAHDVARLSPNALFFNYGNPMTANVAAMRRHAGVDVVGLCHGVAHVHRQLAGAIGKPVEETSILYCGLNHLTFIYDFRWHGEDVWPLVRARREAERSWPLDPEALGRPFGDGVNPFSWEFFDRYGAYPAANDRHVVEFFPERFRGRESYYGKTLGEDAFSLRYVVDWGEARYQSMRRDASATEPLDERLFERSAGDQEELIEILRSIDADSRRTFSINVPNDGLVPNLPAAAVLEVPGVATGRGLRPIAVPDLPDELAAILQRRLPAVDVTIAAALSGDRRLFEDALLLDGAVTDPGVARRMVERFLAEQAEYLPRFG